MFLKTMLSDVQIIPLISYKFSFVYLSITICRVKLATDADGLFS